MAAPKLSPAPVYLEPEVADTTTVASSALPGEASSGRLTEHQHLMLRALGDRGWDWRTLEGLQRSTNLPSDVVLQWLADHSVIVERMSTLDHGLVYRLRDPRRSRNERFYLWIDRVLDYVSFGKRSQSA
jgi:hypothetical protein